MLNHNVVELSNLQVGELVEMQESSDGNIVLCAEGHTLGGIHHILGNGNLNLGSLAQFGGNDHETAQDLNKA